MKDHEANTHEDRLPPKHAMRTRIFEVDNISLPLPINCTQYTAVEACIILTQIQSDQSTTLDKVVHAMFNYRYVTCGDISPIIPCTRSAMFRMFAKYRKDPDVKWKMRGNKLILYDNRFVQTIHKFEKDEDRAVGKDDVKSLLKDAKVEIARK